VQERLVDDDPEGEFDKERENDEKYKTRIER
jgi:hypothetical protein